MVDKAEEKLTYEIVLNAGGTSIMTSRVTERAAELTAKSFGIAWPTDCAVHWPLTIRKIGIRLEVEAAALAKVLRPVIEIPDGEIVIWLAGKRGALDGEPAEDGPEIVDLETALAEVRATLEEETGPDWGWILRVGRTGEALSK